MESFEIDHVEPTNSNFKASPLKWEAALLVASGKQQFSCGNLPVSHWELSNHSIWTINSSVERQEVINTIAHRVGLSGRPRLSGDFQTVAEELCSNAIFHAYLDGQGKAKYPRRQAAHLLESERVQVSCARNRDGLFLSVQDQGGQLTFEDIRTALWRSREKSGLGLGISMVFELVTHLKISVKAGCWTRVSGWLPDSALASSEGFSFNFVEVQP